VTFSAARRSRRSPPPVALNASQRSRPSVSSAIAVRRSGRCEHSVRQRYPGPVSGGGARDKVLPGPVGLLGTESPGIPGGRAVPHQQQPVPRGRSARDRARVEGGLPHPPIQVAAVGVEPCSTDGHGCCPQPAELSTGTDSEDKELAQDIGEDRAVYTPLDVASYSSWRQRCGWRKNGKSRVSPCRTLHAQRDPPACHDPLDQLRQRRRMQQLKRPPPSRPGRRRRDNVGPRSLLRSAVDSAFQSMGHTSKSCFLRGLRAQADMTLI
jgi:hypothetical protein